MQSHGRQRVRHLYGPSLHESVVEFSINGGVLSSSPCYPGTLLLPFEQMFDIVGSKDTFNPCTHIKLTGEPGRFPVDYVDYAGPLDIYGNPTVDHWRWVCKDPIATMPDPVSAMSEVPPIPPSVISDAALKSFKEATSQFPEDVSIANFLIELQEGVRGMLPSLDDVRKLWSSGLLSWEFGLRPFFDDLKKLQGSYEHAIKRLKFLRDHNFKKTVIHRTEIIKGDRWGFTPPSDAFIQASAGPNHCFMGGRCFPEELTCKFTSGIVILPKLVGLDNTIAELVGLFSTVGLNNPAKILWNAIPFSWLADWFVKLDNLLDDLAVQVFPGTIDVLDMWHSTTVECSLGMYHSSRSGTPTYGMSRTSTLQYTCYNRVPYLPLTVDQDHWLEFDLTPKQLAILLALVNEHLWK